MCGITGIFDLGQHARIDTALLRRMTDASVIAAPTATASTSNRGVGLGHRRLAIIDPAAGHQPMYNEDGSVAIVYNGMIYNFQDLRPELEARGHVFRTRCDTETIIHAWESWGPECLQRLNGFFAFALWDRNRRDAVPGPRPDGQEADLLCDRCRTVASYSDPKWRHLTAVPGLTPHASAPPRWRISSPMAISRTRPRSTRRSASFRPRITCCCGTARPAGREPTPLLAPGGRAARHHRARGDRGTDAEG